MVKTFLWLDPTVVFVFSPHFCVQLEILFRVSVSDFAWDLLAHVVTVSMLVWTVFVGDIVMVG